MTGSTETGRPSAYGGSPAPDGKVALTFDDGPNPTWTPRLLDALAEAGARATFFVVAPLAARFPSLLRRAVDEGHEVALHCTRHTRHDTMSAAEIVADATEALRTLRDLGHAPRDWRTPWGVVTPDTRDVAERLGLRLVGWTADTEDWRGEAVTKMLARVETLVRPGAIILAHDGVGPGALRDDCAPTVELVAPLAGAARSRGLAVATVGELSGPLPAGNPGSVAGV